MSKIDLWPLEETDATGLFTLIDANRSRLHKFWWEQGTRSAMDSRRFIIHAQEEEVGEARPTGLTRGIFAAGSELIGVAGIHSIEWGLGRAALGYWVGEEYDGQGYATEAVHGLARIAFTELMLHEVTISPRAANLASRRVAEKNGFELKSVDHEPAWQLDGEEAPEVAHYRLTAGMAGY